MRYLQLTILKEYKFPETNILLQNVYLLVAMNSGLALGCKVQSFVAHRSTSHDLNKDSFTY